MKLCVCVFVYVLAQDLDVIWILNVVRIASQTECYEIKQTTSPCM